MNDTAVERVRIRPLPAPLGASVDGVDLSTPLDSETFRQIEDAYDRHSVLVFRDQKLTPQQHIAFGRLFGPLEIHVVKKALLTDFPEILLISNVKNEAGEDIGLADAGQTWHTDTSYRQRPSRGSILYALEIPHDEAGRPLGNTKFASTAKAYEDLPVDIKERLAGRKAIHSYAFRKRPEGSQRHKITAQVIDQTPDIAHPVVRTHPKTGRKALYVFEGECVGIEGMPKNEAVPLIQQLTEHSIQDKYIYEHQWKAGDVVMWDNAATLHLAICDYKLPRRRLLYRVTIDGGIPL